MHTQLVLGGGSITIVEGSGNVWEMPPAPMWCEDCAVWVLPEQHSDGERWILHPCHQTETECCEGIVDTATICEECGWCEDCCSCSRCVSCSRKVSDSWGICEECECCEGCCYCTYCNAGHKVSESAIYSTGWCEDCECCADHCVCADSATIPGWEQRGVSVPHRGDATALLRDHLSAVDPVSAMADFYLCEMVRYETAQMAGDPAARRVWRDATALQEGIIAACDDAFRDYALAAIGGELRHHPWIRNNGAMPSARESSWDWFVGLADVQGAEQCARDAAELFRDGSWTHGYGGEPWAIAADVLAMRESGQLSPRLFVDRVFSLQHNSGSLLNKVAWRGESYGGANTSEMQAIGNAHHCSRYASLLYYASQDGREMVSRFAAVYRCEIPCAAQWRYARGKRGETLTYAQRAEMRDAQAAAYRARRVLADAIAEGLNGPRHRYNV